MDTILPVMGLVLAVAGALGVAYAVFRSATVTKTLDLYKEENEALGKALARQQADLLALSERLRGIEEENRVLRNVVTGKEHFDALEREAGKRAAEHASIMAILQEVREQLAELWRGVVRVLGEQ